MSIQCKSFCAGGVLNAQIEELGRSIKQREGRESSEELREFDSKLGQLFDVWQLRHGGRVIWSLGVVGFMVMAGL